jgi:hypothetical protein
MVMSSIALSQRRHHPFGPDRTIGGDELSKEPHTSEK